MRVLSLFSGIGGFDLGFERAGMSVIGMCEIDKYAQKILTRRFNATLHTDVRKVSYERGAVDLICGGFPCQDLSVAGKRRGLAGNRSGLWHEFARIIDEAEPAWVVVENVPGLFSSNDGHDFAVIVDWLAQRGYGVGWRVLDAQGFGLAQRRKRVFIVASFGNPSACTVLLEPESVHRNSQTSGKTRKNNSSTTEKRLGVDIGYAFRANPSASGDKGDGGVNTTLVPTVARTVTAHEGYTQFADYTILVPVTYAIQGNIVDREHGGAHGTGIAENAPMYTLTSADRHAVAVQDISPILRGESKQSLMSGNGNINAPLAIAIGFSGQKSSMGVEIERTPILDSSTTTNVLWEVKGFDPCRIASDQDTIPTLSTYMGTGGNNVPLIGVRRLTPTECERLQGFPDGWTEGQSDAQRYKQLGNAVAVPVAEWIGRRIIGGSNAT